MKTRLTLISLCLVGACGGSSDPGTDTSVSGQAVYRDSSTDHDGVAQDPAAPPAQSASLSIVVEGEGQIPQVDPQCALDPAGAFEADYAGSLELGSDALYAASVGSAQLTTPSGCEIPELTVAAITDIRVRAELTASTENCQTYCAAAARADAEQSCGATAAAVDCRTAAESDASASCMTTCTTETHTIVAETSLSAALLGDLDASALRAAALGDLEANLEFDHMEDADGNVVEF